LALNINNFCDHIQAGPQVTADTFLPSLLHSEKAYTKRSGDIALFIAGFVIDYIRIYVGNECIGRIQADIKVAFTILCDLYMKILAVCENGSVSRYCRGRQEMICRFLQIIPFRNLNSLFDTTMQVTEAEEPLCSPLFGSD
jgi:hypothetical protein